MSMSAQSNRTTKQSRLDFGQMVVAEELGSFSPLQPKYDYNSPAPQSYRDFKNSIAFVGYEDAVTHMIERVPVILANNPEINLVYSGMKSCFPPCTREDITQPNVTTANRHASVDKVGVWTTFALVHNVPADMSRLMEAELIEFLSHHVTPRCMNVQKPKHKRDDLDEPSIPSGTTTFTIYMDTWIHHNPLTSIDEFNAFFHKRRPKSTETVLHKTGLHGNTGNQHAIGNKGHGGKAIQHRIKCCTCGMICTGGSTIKISKIRSTFSHLTKGTMSRRCKNCKNSQTHEVL